MLYTLIIEKSDYTKYYFSKNNESSNEISIIHFDDPTFIRGFYHMDILDYVNDTIKLIHRDIPYIAGELELYSKYSFKPNKRGVPAYIFKPISNHYPKFLVNSTLKRT